MRGFCINVGAGTRPCRTAESHVLSVQLFGGGRSFVVVFVSARRSPRVRPGSPLAGIPLCPPPLLATTASFISASVSVSSRYFFLFFKPSFLFFFCRKEEERLPQCPRVVCEPTNFLGALLRRALTLWPLPESLTATFGYAIRIMSRLFLSLTFFLSFSVLFSSCCFCVLCCWDLFLLRVTFFSLLSTASFLEQPPGRARGKE